jgi:hypothetical protein
VEARLPWTPTRAGNDTAMGAASQPVCASANVPLSSIIGPSGPQRHRAAPRLMLQEQAS